MLLLIFLIIKWLVSIILENLFLLLVIGLIVIIIVIIIGVLLSEDIKDTENNSDKYKQSNQNDYKYKKEFESEYKNNSNYSSQFSQPNSNSDDLKIYPKNTNRSIFDENVITIISIINNANSFSEIFKYHKESEVVLIDTYRKKLYRKLFLKIHPDLANQIGIESKILDLVSQKLNVMYSN